MPKAPAALAAPLFALLLALCCPLLHSAQSDDAAESAVAPLQATGASARALALGGAFVAVDGDSAAQYFNPAGLAGLAAPEFGLHQATWIADTWSEDLAGALPLQGWGVLGGGLGYLDLGEFQGADDLGKLTAPYHAERLSGQLDWAGNVGAALDLGAGIEASQLSWGPSAPANIGADLGLQWRPGASSSLGLAWKGLGFQGAAGALSAPLTLGAAQRFGLGPACFLRAELDASWQQAGTDRLQAGAELVWGGLLALRGGWNQALGAAAAAEQGGPSLGAGFERGPWRLDYAYVPFGALGVSQQLSLSWRFEAAAPAPSLPPPPAPAPVPAGFSITVLPEHYDRALDLQAQGRDAEALAELRLALLESPRDPTLLRAMADYWYCAQDVDRALEAFDQLLRFGPVDPALRVWVEEYRALNGRIRQGP